MKCPRRVYRIAPARGHVPPNVYPCGQAARLRLLSSSFAPLDYVSRSRQFGRPRQRIPMATHNLHLTIYMLTQEICFDCTIAVARFTLYLYNYVILIKSIV